MYRLFANIKYTNGDFERKILGDYTYLEDGLDMLKVYEGHWRDSKSNYQNTDSITFELLEAV